MIPRLRRSITRSTPSLLATAIGITLRALSLYNGVLSGDIAGTAPNMLVAALLCALAIRRVIVEFGDD